MKNYYLIYRTQGLRQRWWSGWLCIGIYSGPKYLRSIGIQSIWHSSSVNAHLITAEAHRFLTILFWLPRSSAILITRDLETGWITCKSLKTESWLMMNVPPTRARMGASLLPVTTRRRMNSCHQPAPSYTAIIAPADGPL